MSDHITVKVTVQFFSRLKEVGGEVPLERVLPEGTTLGELLAQLMTEFPGLLPWRAHLLIAVGLDYAPLEMRLSDGDEISIMPPVQGG